MGFVLGLYAFALIALRKTRWYCPAWFVMMAAIAYWSLTVLYRELDMPRGSGGDGLLLFFFLLLPSPLFIIPAILVPARKTLNRDNIFWSTMLVCTLVFAIQNEYRHLTFTGKTIKIVIHENATDRPLSETNFRYEYTLLSGFLLGTNEIKRKAETAKDGTLTLRVPRRNRLRGYFRKDGENVPLESIQIEHDRSGFQISGKMEKLRVEVVADKTTPKEKKTGDAERLRQLLE